MWHVDVALHGISRIPHTGRWAPTAMLADVARELFVQGKVLSGALVVENNAGCVPSVPIADRHITLVVSTEAQVREHFERPDAFWTAGWSRIDRFQDRRLLVRAESAVDSPELLQLIQPHQWAMVRALKPGQVRRSRSFPPAAPDELEVFEEGSPLLDTVGYLPTSKTLEMSCARPLGGEHVHGWEIWRLGRMLTQGKLPDGQPLEHVRVVFLDEAAARDEKRALLEFGIAVYYIGESGVPVPLAT